MVDVGSDVKIVQDTLIDGFVARIQNEGASANESVFQTQSDYFFNFQSGVEVKLDVVGAPRYSVAPTFTPLSTIADMTVSRFRSFVNATETTGTTLVNYGLSILSSAAATAQFFVMLAPVVGGLKMVAVGQNTASEITLQGTATTILFGSTGADKIFFSGADIRGLAVTLVGITATRWANVGGVQTGVTHTGGA